MQDTSLHLDAFCQFWEMNFSSPVPPLPKRPEDLTVTQAEQLRIFDGGKLYQNLFKVTDPKNYQQISLEILVRVLLIIKIRTYTGSLAGNMKRNG